MTTIRQATSNDVPALLALGREMHAESPRFAALGFVDEKAEAFIHMLIGNGVALVAEEDEGHLVGMLGGFVVEHFFSYEKVASDAAVYVSPERRGGTVFPRLIAAFEHAAHAAGATDIVLGVSTEVHAEQTARCYERMGYARSGFTMRKKVRNV